MPLRDVLRSSRKVCQFVRRVDCVAVQTHERNLTGGCDLDKTYDGPKLPADEDGQYYMSRDFIHQMHEYFKQGKTLPRRSVSQLGFAEVLQLNVDRRYVWEIIIGAHNAFVKEESLVTLNLDEGVDCDVIGDVHGKSAMCNTTSKLCRI